MSGKSVRPKKKCCVKKPRCRRCPLRMLAEGTLPAGYTVRHRKLVAVGKEHARDAVTPTTARPGLDDLTGLERRKAATTAAKKAGKKAAEKAAKKTGKKAAKKTGKKAAKKAELRPSRTAGSATTVR